MSQSHNPKDNQALLQSMLQRLKLQAGTTNVDSGYNSTVGQNAQSKTSDVPVNNNAINGFEPTDNLKREFTVNGKILSSGDSKTCGQSKDFGQDSLSQGGQLQSPKQVNDVANVFSEGSNCKTKKDILSESNTRQSTEQPQDGSFVPKVYSWSLNQSGGQGQFGGDVFGAMGQTTKTLSSSLNTTNNRKQRSSEKKTQRWTQKIKEKWRDRPGSFGNKRKEDRQGTDKTLHENSPQYQPVKTENNNSTSNEETGGIPASVDSTENTKSHTQAADGNEEYMRTTTDFDLGLGSFSLLDEIASGQEWAKFLNSTIPLSIPIRQDQTTSQETVDHPLLNHVSSNSGLNSESKEAGKSLSIFGMSRHPGLVMTQSSPEASLPGMDITEKNQRQSEPMDHGQNQSDLQISERGPQLKLQPAAKLEPANAGDNLFLKGRNSLSRKRQYQLTERIETTFPRDISNGNETIDDGSVFLLDNPVLDRTDGSHGKIMSPCSSTPTPWSLVPRGVLKKSFSKDSESSMETVVKKRRVEENRRVRFSEEIITINLPDLGPDLTDTEEQDSSIEDDSEEQADPLMLEPIQLEEVAPGRRAAISAWMRALKRKNTGKKPR